MKPLKMTLFKNASFKVKNNALVAYPYQTHAPYTTPIPAKNIAYFYSFLTAVFFHAKMLKRINMFNTNTLSVCFNSWHHPLSSPLDKERVCSSIVI